MMTTFQQILDSVRQNLPISAAVAAAHDGAVLLSVRNAADLGIISSAVLVGNKALIYAEAKKNDVELTGFSIVDETDPAAMCRRAVSLVASNQAQIVMKGLVDTSQILKAVLDHESGLRDAQLLSHVAVFEVSGLNRLLLLTDGGMNISPSLHEKKLIIQNSLRVASALGIEEPNVACLCALEKVNPKMQATVDAAALLRMNREGELTGCTVSGPLALDNAVSEQAARHKGIGDPVAGKADILLVPQIESGNILYKSLVFLAGAKNAGVIVGARAPVVLTSRADSSEAKLHSIALAVRMAQHKGGAV